MDGTENQPPYSPPASGEVAFVDLAASEGNRTSTRGMFSSFKAYPSFRLLWLSSLFFFGGVWTQTLILGWLVFDLTDSTFLLALFTAARLGPMMLGPIGGMIADRFDRARFLLFTMAWAFVAVSALAILVSTGLVTYWYIIVGGFCIGLAQSPAQPARFTLVSDIVDRSQLSNANALNSMALTMTQVIGPAIGGVMISAFGVSAALWISAAWYPISFITLWPIKSLGQVPKGQQTESAIKQISSGFRILLRDRTMASVLFVTFAANIFLWPVFQAFMPVFAKDILDLNASGLGWLLACSGIGAVIGSLGIAFLGDFKHKGGMFVFGTAAWGGFWMLFALSKSVPVSFALMGLVGFCSAAFGVLQSTLLLMLAPHKIRGQAMGIQELAIGILPVMTILHGLVAGLIGVDYSTAISGFLLMLMMLLLAIKVPELRRYSGSRLKERPIKD